MKKKKRLEEDVNNPHFDKENLKYNLREATADYFKVKKPLAEFFPLGPNRRIPWNEFSAWFNSLFQILASLFN